MTFKKDLGVHAPEQKGHDLVDLSALDENRRQEAVDIIQEVINLTREVLTPRFESDEPPCIVVHPGGSRPTVWNPSRSRR